MGYVEHIEIDWKPRYVEDDDDTTLPPQALPLLQWWEYMQTASARLRKPIAYQENTRSLLTRTGFTDINHRTVVIPLQPTPRDQRDHALESGFKDAMCREDELGQPSRSFESLSMSLFTRHLGFDPDHVRSLCTAVGAICESRRIPLYFNM